MKTLKFILAFVAFFTLTSFFQEKRYKLEFSESDLNKIYVGLGKLPAEEVDGLRQYILSEYTKQKSDSTKIKK